MIIKIEKIFWEIIPLNFTTFHHHNYSHHYSNPFTISFPHPFTLFQTPDFRKFTNKIQNNSKITYKITRNCIDKTPNYRNKITYNTDNVRVDKTQSRNGVEIATDFSAIGT